MNGFTGMTRDEVAKSIAAAAHTWSPAAVTCPDGVSHPFLEIVPSMADQNATAPAPAYDAHSTVLFYTPDRPYPENSGLSWEVVALTAGWARADGHIVDADVRINAYDSLFANLDPGFVPPANGDTPYDLQNAVTHEFGHVIGLGHSCWNIFSDIDQPIDVMDAGVPTCGNAPADVQDTVMFATIPPGSFETKKRNLSPDEIRAACEIYPASAGQYACSLDVPDDGCGCSASASGAGTASAWACLALLSGGAVVRRRRRRSRAAAARSARTLPARRADRE
jgi:hypothetical protein